MAVMNGITISLICLAVISTVLPASAIMYASGQSTDNSDYSSTHCKSDDCERDGDDHRAEDERYCRYGEECR
jgi:hypothetical protein